MPTISQQSEAPASDLRNMVNACKLRNVGDLAIFIQESKNQNLEPPDLIQITNAILAHDLKKLQEDVKKHKSLEEQQLEVNDWEEYDKAIIHSKELPQTKIHTEIIQQSLEKQLAEARREEKVSPLPMVVDANGVRVSGMPTSAIFAKN